MPSILLRNLRKQFGTALPAAVEDVSLDIPSGELLTIVGPSGSGKSTLLRLIAGLERPTSGEILFDGRDVTNSPPVGRNVAMVFQGDNHFPHLNVRENLVVGLRLRRQSDAVIESRLNSAVSSMRLADLLDRWPESLSGGESQRVALGRILTSQAAIGLLDEPLVHVDPSQRAQLYHEIRTLHRGTDATIIHVTHDQLEAMSLAMRMAVMHKGRILQVDVPQRVYSAPVNTFVATFIGYPPMNLFSDCVVGGALQRLGARGLAIDIADGPVLVGIRPERLQVEGQGEICLTGRVRAVEHLGAEQILEIETGATRCSVRTATLHEYPPDASIELHCNQADLHFFSPDADEPRIERRENRAT